MNDNIYLIAFGTFGNPNGFRQSPFIAKDQTVFKSIKTFDLNTNAIKLFPGNKLYSIRKETLNGSKTVAYSVYTFAKEQNSDRGGTFIGSSLLFANEIPAENLTLSKLNEFHQILTSKNTENDVILVDHSDNFSAVIPQDFDKLIFDLKDFDDLTNFNFNNKFLVVFCETSPNKLNTYLKESLKLLNNYDTIYFTDSEEIAKFVNEKGIYKLIQNVGNQRDFEDELQQFKLEKKKLVENQILEFEKERQNLESDKKKQLAELQEQLLNNQRSQEENLNKINASKTAVSEIGENYAKFSAVINESISLLKANHKIENVRQFYEENKKQFIENLKNGKEVSSFKMIAFSDLKVKTDLKNTIESLPKWTEGNNYPKSSGEKKTKSKYNIYKIIAFSSLLLWIGGLIYFLGINNKKADLASKKVNIYDSIYSEINAKNDLSSKLNPIPDDSLSKVEYKDLAKKFKESLKIDEIADIIFSQNPDVVKKYYQFQKKDYKDLLFKKNMKSFYVKGNDTLFSPTDSLKIIPARMAESETAK
ncbi:hypothetical protein [Halpernia frigidisoli]|uniref:Uncharacterized protein n=1 Tax=Halpernia frigidisoli TaxID=1125876 RepID=A0A1I3IS23_9FLAO|nr:hypothetical protein [Halpernia frigidisoli]SFI50687.1 hypothetical protein SAMN05443292_2755 [Halpernia frigidisoli]